MVQLPSQHLKNVARREAVLFLGFLFFGFIVMPIGIYLVGKQVFGAYGGYGYGDFFGTLSAMIRSLDFFAWFLVLSPYLAWQTLRLVRFGWRKADDR